MVVKTNYLAKSGEMGDIVMTEPSIGEGKNPGNEVISAKLMKMDSQAIGVQHFRRKIFNAVK